MNHIEEVRREITTWFDPALKIADSEQTSFSPDGKYRLLTAEYRQNKSDVNWTISAATVFEHATSEKIFSIHCNHGQFIHTWLTVEKTQYLVCAEDIYGGHTIMDLSNRKMESYSPGVDGFIATDYHLSPKGDVLAILGCFWACPFVLKLYRFDHPLALPWKEFQEIEIDHYSIDSLQWIDHTTLQLTDKSSEKKKSIKVHSPREKQLSKPGV